MKRCPKCRRDYYDDTLLYCLEDGAALVQGSVPATESDEPATAILHETAAPGEAATRAQIYTTERTPLPSGITEVPKGKGFDKRLILAPIVLSIIVLGGYFGYKYFSPTKQIESIAVMPFLNESGSPDVDYLSDGMTETLINSLSQISTLSVKARSSVFRYKGKDLTSQAIGKELNVQAILNGRIKLRGDQITLSLELLDAATENVIWSDTYDRKRADVVMLQSEIARDVSNKLKSRLSGDDLAKVEKTGTGNPEAYQLYLKGKFAWNKRTAESLRQAAGFYTRAIELDPNYALAYSGLAETYVLFSSWEVASARDSMPQAKAAALRALAIDDSLAPAHSALGFYLENYEWDRAGAEREFKRAIALNPDYATAHHWYGAFLGNVKRFDEALVQIRLAQELDPLSPIIGTNLGDVLTYSRRYDEAIAQYKSTLVRNPDFPYAHQTLGWAHGLEGSYSEAIAATLTAINISDGADKRGFYGLWLARSGRRDEAVKELAELKMKAESGYVQHYPLALINIGLGNRSEALDFLEAHMEMRAETANVYAVAPELDDLRSEPRFKSMLKRMNLPD